MKLSAAILIAVSIWATGADTAGRVTLCASDVDAGTPGTLNLATAITSGGRVTFDCPVGTILRITRAHLIDQATEIDGEGKVTLDAGHTTAMFDATNGGSPLVISNITLRNGVASGTFFGTGTHFAGLIFGPISLRMSNVNVEGTHAPIAVNAIETNGGRFSGNTATVIRTLNATISGTEFSDNNGPPLAPVSASSIPGLDGLAIGESAVINGARLTGNDRVTWRGHLVIKHSIFANNGRPSSNGGAIWLSGSGTIEKSEFTNNHSLHGGAIGLESGTLDVRRVTFTGNKAEHSGGAISVGISRPNTPAAAQFAKLRVTYSKFERNSASFGGGVMIARGSPQPSSLSGKLVHFAGNTASVSGGAIDSIDGTVHLHRVVFVGNQAAIDGGAISAAEGLRRDSTSLGNALIVRNTALRGGGYVGSQLLLVNSTVADNQGGGIRGTKPGASEHSALPTAITLQNSIVSNNGGGNCPLPDDGPWTFAGFANIQNPSNSCEITIASADPQLDSLYVPNHRSPARNAGNNEVCLTSDLVAGRDVYGDGRPEGTNCTIGAVEGDLEDHVLAAAREIDESYLPKPIRELLATLGIERYPGPFHYEK